MPPKAAKRTAVKRKPLGKVDGNAVRKPATKSTGKNSKGARASPKTSAKQATNVEDKPAESQDLPNASQQATQSDANKPVYYLFLCRLSGTENPTITRLLSVPAALRFNRFHAVLQTAFGWSNSHMYSFDIRELEPPDKDNNPVGPGRHVLGLTNFPMTDEGQNAEDYRLSDVFESEKYAGTMEVLYTYDQGDSWEHDIVFLGRESPSVREVMQVPQIFPAICLNGEGHPCAEDSGGIDGWEDLKELFAKPRSRDPENLRAWYKNNCLNGDPKGLDPYKWNIFDVNDELSELAERPDFL